MSDKPFRAEFDSIEYGFRNLPAGFKLVPGHDRSKPYGLPVPGVGSILCCFSVDGKVCAIRSDGSVPVVYVASTEGWTKLAEVRL